MLPIKLFRLVFCLFRFNRNIETLCLGIEAKQPKQMFCFGQCRNQFWLFRIETSFEGHPNSNLCPETWIKNAVQEFHLRGKHIIGIVRLPCSSVCGCRFIISEQVCRSRLLAKSGSGSRLRFLFDKNWTNFFIKNATVYIYYKASME